MPRELRHPDPRDVPLDRVLSALGDPVRLRIMAVLADREEHPREDFEVGVGPSTVSHHMRTLREAGLTRHRLEGTRCFVSLRKETLRRYPDVLEGVLRTCAQEAVAAGGPAAGSGGERG
ncbi:ArsR/SmtB family transcription factor [Streptomyces iconiensis]|uniref:Metalloregulator ArsR/SmtB family transcription factor n=1 Tax=Streptomyces iconiensis TaxID=1384038 RepID=A0ABT6ZTZ6_9ACTN|nr:metalloregulator ArsR/SmtB family transcription factor [Streptomyces iconiensis]MDJ1132529.1 metalloregulator ArsR/SmtB family transcription factor [Streptomyces iconiensis]